MRQNQLSLSYFLATQRYEKEPHIPLGCPKWLHNVVAAVKTFYVDLR